MTRILGIIPARGGSKGIEKKNIRPLAGRPLIEYTFDAVRGSKRLERVILSTDSPEIAEIGKKSGVEVPFMRPAKISGDNSPAVEYIRHALDHLRKNEGYRPDIVVLLQPTTPFRTAEDVDACIDMLEGAEADSVVSVSKIPSKYHPNWQLSVDGDNELKALSGGWGTVASRRQELDQTYTRNGAVYAFRRDSFEKTGTIYGRRSLAYIMPEDVSVNIDDINDWLIAESFLLKKDGGK